MALSAQFAFSILSATKAVVVTQGLPNAEAIPNEDSHIRMIVFFALVPVTVVFSFIVFIFYRKKREAFFRQTQAELNLKIAQVEIKAIKAQINPHFIFNCMNSIHHYMHKNDVKQAGDYLIKFSQLIRWVLENASLSTVTLKEELESLTLYIQLEQLRLNQSFQFEINVSPELPADLEIPNFLIQPFVENAIWHGLSKIKAEGKLAIHLERKGNVIHTVIESSGIGRQQSVDTGIETMVKKTSMGINLIRERIALINKTGGPEASFQIEDASVDGTYCYRVNLIVPIDLQD